MITLVEGIIEVSTILVCWRLGGWVGDKATDWINGQRKRRPTRRQAIMAVDSLRWLHITDSDRRAAVTDQLDTLSDYLRWHR